MRSYAIATIVGPDAVVADSMNRSRIAGGSGMVVTSTFRGSSWRSGRARARCAGADAARRSAWIVRAHLAGAVSPPR